MKPRVLTARLSCPWCDWLDELENTDPLALLEEGRRVIARHNAEAGHRVKPGRRPRTGYYRGEPMA
jgi:hypothetical protein